MLSPHTQKNKKTPTQAKEEDCGFLLYTFRFHAVVLWCSPFCLLLFVKLVLVQLNQIVKWCWKSPHQLRHGFTCSRETRLEREPNLRIWVNIEVCPTVWVLGPWHIPELIWSPDNLQIKNHLGLFGKVGSMGYAWVHMLRQVSHLGLKLHLISNLS